MVIKVDSALEFSKRPPGGFFGIFQFDQLMLNPGCCGRHFVHEISNLIVDDEAVDFCVSDKLKNFERQFGCRMVADGKPGFTLV